MYYKINISFMNVKNDFKLKQLFVRKNLSTSRISQYVIVLNAMYELTGLNPSELIDEAKDEEKYFISNNQISSIDIADRKITKYFFDYYKYLSDSSLKNSSINNYLSILRAFYTEYNVELPKKIKLQYDHRISRSDLLSKDCINLLLENTNLRNKTLILFLASSGMRISDALNLRISDLLVATDFKDIDSLLSQDPRTIIPSWEFIPIKTRKKGNICITFNSIETSLSLFSYLKSRKNLNSRSYLFASFNESALSKTNISLSFKNLNDKLFGKNELGKRYFSAHKLRKFFINTLTEHSGDIRKISLMSGHVSPVATDKNYVNMNIKSMKEFYIKIMPFLTIYEESNFYTSEYISDLESRLAQLENLVSGNFG